MNRAIAWDAEQRYLVADAQTVTEMTLARIVDLRSGQVSPPLLVGSILAQSDPDDWQFEEGPDAARAVGLVR